MNRKTLKAAISFVLVVLFVLSLVACGTQQDNKATGQTTSSAATQQQSVKEETKNSHPVELTFSTFNEWITQGEGIKNAFKMYEDATGNTIKQDIYPNDQFTNIIRTKLATGDVPDFYAINMGEEYVPYTNLEPLDGPWVEKMLPNVKARAIRQSDGKVCMAYFHPLSYYCVVYNKDVFNKAGVKIPLMNYKQLLDACEAIKKVGVTPIYLMGKETWTADMITTIAGVYMLKEDPESTQKLLKNELKPSEMPGFIEMAKRTLALKPYINKDFMSVPLTAGIDRVVNGECAMTFMLDSYYGEVNQKFPDKVSHVSIMPATLGDDYISAVSGVNQRAFAVPAAGKNKQTAKEAINYFLQQDVFKTLVEPFTGGSPYEGYEIGMSPWQNDMETLIKQNNIPVTDTLYKTSAGSFDFGSTNPWQEMFAGKDIVKAYDDWYAEYAKLNRAKKTPGF
jgi:ABC-type sugar transport system, periplasmic component